MVRSQVMAQPYRIGTLAAAAGVHVETIRYYQRRGLIPEPRRSAAGMRRYSDADVERLRFIKHAQAVGFSLAEIPTLLTLRSRKSCRETRELAMAKLQVVDVRLRALQNLKRELKQWIGECDVNSEDSTCPVIDRLAM